MNDNVMLIEIDHPGHEREVNRRYQNEAGGQFDVRFYIEYRPVFRRRAARAESWTRYRRSRKSRSSTLGQPAAAP
jgi:hypothetical protein